MSDLGNRAIMAENIQRLMENKGKTRTEVCEDLGIKYTTFADWVNGKTYPRIDKIELMANYFGVPKSELVERYTYDVASLNDLHYRGIIFWSEDISFSVPERIAIKKHLDDLLSRYKAFVEATRRCKISLNEYLSAIEQFNNASESPLSKRELIKRYLAQNLEQELKDMSGWIEAAPFYLSEAMELSLDVSKIESPKNNTTHTVDGPETPPGGTQTAPAPQEGKDTTPSQDGQERPSEGE